MRTDWLEGAHGAPYDYKDRQQDSTQKGNKGGYPSR